MDFDIEDGRDEVSMGYLSNEEEARLGGSSPFITILKLGIGPMFFMSFNSIQDAFQLFLAREGYGATGVTVISISDAIIGIIFSLSSFFNQGLTIKMSELITKKHFPEANKLFVDMIRLTFFLGILIPFGIICATPYLLKALGMPNDYMNTARSYIFPIVAVMFFNMAFEVVTASLYAIGKSGIVSTIRIISLIFSMCIFILFIFILKLPISLLGLAIISGPTIFCIGYLIHFMLGKEIIAPECNMFLEKPSKNLWYTFKMSIPALLQIIVNASGPLIVTSAVTLAASHIGQTTNVSTVYSTSAKPLMIVMMGIMGAVSGLNTAATFSYHKGDMKRVKALALCSLVLPFIILAVIWPMMVFKPNLVMGIWINENEMIKWVSKITPKLFYTLPLVPINLVISSLIIVLGKSGLAILPCFTKFFTLILSLIFLYKRFSNNPENLLYCCNIADVEDFICNLICALYALKEAKPYIESFKVPDSPLLPYVDSTEE